MKMQNLGILTLIFVLLVSTFCTSTVFAEENTASAAFAKVDINEYIKPPETSNYPSISTFDDGTDNYYGTDYDSAAFGKNLWYQALQTNNVPIAYNSTGVTVQGWGTGSTERYMVMKGHGTPVSSTITGAFRKLATPISCNADATYYFDFTAKMGAVTSEANEVRLGLLENQAYSGGGSPASQTVRVYGGLKKHATNSTYHAQVSLDGGATVALSETAFNLGTKYQFLLRLDIDADGNDTLSMKVFEAGTAEPAAWTVSTTGNMAQDQEILGIDACDNTAVVSLYKLEAEKYDTALLNSVQSTVDAFLANFKYSQADSIEETIKTLPFGKIRSAYETKLAALKEQNNTFFLKEEFNYAPDLSDPNHGWEQYQISYYNTKINTLTKSDTAINGWKAGSGWSTKTWDEVDSTRPGLSLQYNSVTEAKGLQTRANDGTYRQLENVISCATDGVYYFACDAQVGNDYPNYVAQIDSRIIFGDTNNYVGLKFKDNGIYAQMSFNGTTLIGTKKYNSAAEIIYRFVSKLEIADGNLTLKMKVFPKDGAEPGQWELVSAPAAVADIKYIGFNSIAVNVGMLVCELCAEKYTSTNLTALNDIENGIANGTITTEQGIENVIDIGIAQNDLVASLGLETAPILGQDISYSDGTLSLKVHNSRSSAAYVTPIMVLYNDGAIAGIIIGEKATLAAKTRNQNVGAAFNSETLPASYDSVRAFFWNDILELKPVLDTWTIAVTQ